jgi:hypothetical protein
MYRYGRRVSSVYHHPTKHPRGAQKCVLPVIYGLVGSCHSTISIKPITSKNRRRCIIFYVANLVKQSIHSYIKLDRSHCFSIPKPFSTIQASTHSFHLGLFLLSFKGSLLLHCCASSDATVLFPISAMT